MRRGLVVLVLTGLVAVLSVGPVQVARAACAAPSVDVARGQLLLSGTRITGDAFNDGGCQDYGSCSDRPGCGGQVCEYPDPPGVAADDVVLGLRQGDRWWRLGVADADAEWRVAWTVTLPDDVHPGPARLVTDRPGTSVLVRVR